MSVNPQSHVEIDSESADMVPFIKENTDRNLFAIGLRLKWKIQLYFLGSGQLSDIIIKGGDLQQLSVNDSEICGGINYYTSYVLFDLQGRKNITSISISIQDATFFDGIFFLQIRRVLDERRFNCTSGDIEIDQLTTITECIGMADYIEVILPSSETICQVLIFKGNFLM